MGPTPITITNAYNNRLQPLLISAAGASTIISLCYDFHLITVPTPNTACSLVAGSGDNGNVFQIVNNRDNNRSQNFLYDSLNRISQAYTSGPNWGETFGPVATNPGVPPTSSGIDAWGNLTNRSGVVGKTMVEGLSCTVNTQNQLGACSLTYDAAGNVIRNGNTVYTYDAENRLIATTGMSYKYDGDGKRVEKCTAGATPGTCATNAVGILYWTGWGNDPLAETDLAGNVLENYIFFNGQRIARREPGSTPTIHFYFSDHLGSHGVVTDKTGSTCEQDIDYYPYGGVENDYCGTVPQHYKFTGKERDTESGLDNFGARYHESTFGRFLTPDQTTISAARFTDPQRWAMYSYARNNPLAYLDPNGFETVWLGYFWRTDWIPTGRGWAAFDLLAGMGPGVTQGKPGENRGFSPRQYDSRMNSARNLLVTDAGEEGPMCPIACGSVYQARTNGYFLTADITIDPSNSAASKATLSESLDPNTGSLSEGPIFRLGNTLVGPPSDTFGVNIYRSNIAKLSDADLTAVGAAVNRALLSHGYDEAIFAAQVQIDVEESKRLKRLEKEAHEQRDKLEDCE